MLKNKKFALTPSVTEIIEKHHERVDGKGFPAALAAHKIPLPAQLLAFSDWFEYLMRPEPGKPRLSPLEVAEKIQTSAGLSVELIAKIKKFFSSLESQAQPEDGKLKAK
ncbi:MAG TPA: HD domain-containing phosphohydrolase [Bdellovibrionales bacterium]|nr:HD domain-containing phosphohydrolase [Bdellovibrionales bacterium]